jgi:hypothetical protein
LQAKAQSFNSITTPFKVGKTGGISSIQSDIGWSSPKTSPLSNRGTMAYPMFPAAPLTTTLIGAFDMYFIIKGFTWYDYSCYYRIRASCTAILKGKLYYFTFDEQCHSSLDRTTANCQIIKYDEMCDDDY